MSADLRPLMDFTERRGPAGAVWFEAKRGEPRFVVFRRKDGSWKMFERVNPDPSRPEETGARLSAPPRPPSRTAPRKMRRELVDLGLVSASDVIEEVPVRASVAGTSRGRGE